MDGGSLRRTLKLEGHAIVYQKWVPPPPPNFIVRAEHSTAHESVISERIHGPSCLYLSAQGNNAI